MAASTSTIAELFKEYVDPIIAEQLNQMTATYNLFPHRAGEGKQINVRAHTTRNTASYLAEGGSYASASNQGIANIQLSWVRIQVPIEVTKTAIAASRISAAALKEALTYELTMGVKDMLNYINYGVLTSDGTGSPASIDGLIEAIDDGTNYGTYAGLTRSSSTWAKAQYMANGGTNRDLTLDLMRQMRTKIEKKGGRVKFIDCSPELRDKYEALLFAAVRYVNPTVNDKLAAGFTSLAFGDAKLVGDPLPLPASGSNTFANTMYFLGEEVEVRELRPVRTENIASTSDSVKAVVVWEGNVVCRFPAGQGQLRDLNQ